MAAQQNCADMTIAPLGGHHAEKQTVGYAASKRKGQSAQMASA
jgi:hypothetical protein